MTATNPGIPAPQLLTERASVRGLLEEARKARSLFLRDGELYRSAIQSGQEVNRDVQGNVKQQSSKAVALWGMERPKELGHAPAWLDAGSLYEELVMCAGEEGRPDYIFCLDPWSAQLLTRTKELMPEAKWVLVTDLSTEKDVGDSSYWESMQEWFRSLPFAAIVAREAWVEAVSSYVPPARAGFRELRPSRVHLARLGAWRWMRVTGPISAGTPALEDVTFLTRFSGSLLHIKLFLESVARQNYPKRSLRVFILLGDSAPELNDYLRWFAIAQPELRIETIQAGPKAEGDWDNLRGRLRRERPHAHLVKIDDYAILPLDFCSAISGGDCSREPRQSRYAEMSLEACAHLATGNLDPVTEYDKLLAAFRTAGTGDRNMSCADRAVSVPPDLWVDADEKSLARIFGISAEEDRMIQDLPPISSAGGVLLKLVDLA